MPGGAKVIVPGCFVYGTWPPRPLGWSPITVLHQSPRMYPSEIDSGRSSGSTLCLSITKPFQFSPWLDTPREDGPRRSASKCVFLLARTRLLSFTSPHDLKPHHPRNRKDRLARAHNIMKIKGSPF